MIENFLQLNAPENSILTSSRPWSPHCLAGNRSFSFTLILGADRRTANRLLYRRGLLPRSSLTKELARVDRIWYNVNEVAR